MIFNTFLRKFNDTLWIITSFLYPSIQDYHLYNCVPLLNSSIRKWTCTGSVFILCNGYTNYPFLLMKSEHSSFLLFFIFSPIIQQISYLRKCANYILFPVSITVCMRGLCVRKGNKKRDTPPQTPQKGRLTPLYYLASLFARTPDALKASCFCR